MCLINNVHGVFLAETKPTFSVTVFPFLILCYIEKPFEDFISKEYGFSVLVS